MMKDMIILWPGGWVMINSFHGNILYNYQVLSLNFCFGKPIHNKYVDVRIYYHEQI